FFDEVLPQLGVKTTTRNGLLPITVEGPLTPANITVNGSLSSQFLTGLLMAYSAAKAEHVTIQVLNLASKPYIDLTLNLMQHFGMHVPENNNYREFIFGQLTAPANTGTIEYTVEGDWSGAAFLLAAGAIAGTITIHGLDINSAQADRIIMEILQAAGVRTAMAGSSITVQQGEIAAFHFDATDCPDLFPPLVALAAYANGRSTIKGVNRLTHKESNRALTLQSEFGKLGVNILLNKDEMTIEGGGPVRGAVVHSGNDHRIAMACAVAALGAGGAVHIEGAEAIKKSYPGFYNDLRSLGAKVSYPVEQNDEVIG
ncbi:MAG: 3-phosphoshikimate 1-carboxyvinyltransferase, partial [Dinghuibacter sp.]|nr:3-phosphoshikimate 1-carboxyvinyltransferase [Dinghuibacter sp.]